MKIKKAWDDMTNSERLDIIKLEYTKQETPINALAIIYDTYTNKIRRFIQKNNVPLLDAKKIRQKTIASRPHPTKGKHRSQETKLSISQGVRGNWDDMDVDKKEKICKIRKRQWKLRSKEDKERMQKKAIAGLQKAGKEGSKIEKYIRNRLLDENYQIYYHDKHTVGKEKMHLDILVVYPSIAIEIDGPTHHKVIWNKELLAKRKRADIKKGGLLLQSGISLIRVKTKQGNFSISSAEEVVLEIIKTIKTCDISQPTIYHLDE